MKVFLSSTYLDLIEHRKATINALRTMGEEVEHMEIFGARDAEGLAREALALAEKVGRQELIATDYHRIAKSLLKQNKNLDEALSLSRRAVEILSRLRHRDLQEAQETLAEIEEKMRREQGKESSKRSEKSLTVHE